MTDSTRAPPDIEERLEKFLGPPDWVNDYIGLPYRLNGRERDGLDCWGLISLVWREKRGIQIPDFQAPHDADLLAVMQAVADNMPEAVRQAPAVAVEAPVSWDFVVCYRHRLACHVGLFIGGGILHTHPTTSGAVWEPESRFNSHHKTRSYWRWLD